MNATLKSLRAEIETLRADMRAAMAEGNREEARRLMQDLDMANMELAAQEDAADMNDTNW